MRDDAEIGRIFREESGRSVATLIRVFGDIDVAEDAVQEAFAVALRKWPADGLPPNPGGWITTTARNRAVDRLRRDARGRELLAEAREHLGGFYIIEAEDLDAALALASKVTRVIGAPIEVRPFADFADEPRG